MATTYRPTRTSNDRSGDEWDLGSALRYRLQLGLGAPSGRLADAAEHAVAASGKLMRPQLVLDACRAVGGDPASVLPAAIGTELGHIASLVHDDVIDGDTLRRGRPAVHAAFDVPLAILTGDLLVFQMFACYTECAAGGVSADRTVRAIELLSQACVDVCRGQALEAEIAGKFDTSQTTYFEVVRLKTAGVCRAAAEIGATLGGGRPLWVRALRCYGEALGMAFQIVDDLLEYVGQPEHVGKPLDSDVRNLRVTLPLLYAVESGGDVRARALHLLREGASGRAALAELFEDYGILDRAHATAERFTRAAQEHLRALPASEARERLESYAARLLERDR
jgi:geranylgeranyl diphosphate synthase type I